MTISLTYKEFSEFFQEADEEELLFDPSDELDITKKYDGRLLQGWVRSIQLRGGMRLKIEKARNSDRLRITDYQFGAPLRWHFFLSGRQQINYVPSHKEGSFSLSMGRYIVSGPGLEGHCISDCSDAEPFLELRLKIRPGVLHSFIGDSQGELPKVFEHLIRLPLDFDRYKRVGKTSPLANTVLQQILQCPYQGLTKRMYLESKATELMALMLEEEAAIQQGDFKAALIQPDQLDRIHYAKEILLKNLSNPPSLMELARQVGMCDYNLKRGFREVFDTTVFGYLRDRRLEKAQQLLLEQQMKVSSVARAVGYDSPTSFTTAFKRKFGMSPKAYQLSMGKGHK